MRATELVSRADKKITAKGLKEKPPTRKNHLDVRKTVWSIVDSVHIEESLGTKASNNGCSSCNVCDGSARIGGSAESDKPSVGVEQILKMVQIKEAAAWLQIHPEMEEN